MEAARGPTFMEPEEIIAKHQDGTLDERQAVVALARMVIQLSNEMTAVMRAVRQLEEE